jgi:hypothetical protein
MPEILASALCPCGQGNKPTTVARLLLAVCPGKKIRNGKFDNLETSGERIGDSNRVELQVALPSHDLKKKSA